MKTLIKNVDPKSVTGDQLSDAGEIIKNGGLVAFPTETVYGLGGDAFNSKSSEKIYLAKGRPSDNPLIVHIADREDVNLVAMDVSEGANKLMDKFWPGPLTIILKKSDRVPFETTGGLSTVAVRMPDHRVALELIRSAGVPIAAPSANTSGKPSPTKAQHVIEDLDGRIDMIIDAGQVGIGIESTIVDMTGEKPIILRPGYITKEMMEKEIGRVLVDRVVLARSMEELSMDNYSPKAPGMKYKHYAPKAQLTMYEGDEIKVAEKINQMIQMNTKAGKKVGVICTNETRKHYRGGMVVSIGSRQKEETIAHNLYDVLRGFDAAEVDCIYSETFCTEGLGQAIMNRLIKAAGYQVEKL